MKRLPAPTLDERAHAATAAQALRERFGKPALMGHAMSWHVDFARPRRGVWYTRWDNLPGFARQNGVYTHALLPGWTYTKAEVRTEMIPDLERLAATGERPTEATR